VKLLVKGLGQVLFSIVGGAVSPSTNGGNMSTLIANPGYAVVVQEDYFDLAGMTQREKTLFFKTVSIQEPYNPSIEGGHTGDDIREAIVLTTSPIPSDQLLTEYALGPGLFNSTTSWSQLVYYRFRNCVRTTDQGSTAILPTLSQNSMGSAYPTASDRVYIYRFIQANNADQTAQFTSILVPGCQVVLGADVKEEPEFQYLYRLMRSYELQQSHDED